jgi:hypothetical protein
MRVIQNSQTMKIMIHCCLLGVMGLLLAGCATPYQKFQWYAMYAGGGYMDKELEPGVYRVRTICSVLTSPERGNAYTLYRCAEITVEHNCDYFAIITDRMKNGRPQSIQDAVTYLATGIDFSAGRDTRVIQDPVIIRTFKGEKPADYPEAVDAKKVMAQLKPKVLKLYHYGLNDWVRGELEPATTGSADKLADELSRKLGDLGSFQAEYRAVSPDKPPADITILFNQRQKYCLYRVAFAGAATGAEQTNVIYSVLDFSRLKDGSCSFQVLANEKNEGKKFTLSFKELFKRVDNPLGAFYFIARQIGAEMKTDRMIIESTGPVLWLELDSTNLDVSAGFSTKINPLGVSWLGRNMITNAINVVESPDSVQFTYKDNHVVLVDQKTGLLLKDSWPDPIRPGPREIVLQSHSPIQRSVPYASVIPGFDNVKFEERPPTQPYEQMSVSFLTVLGRKLSAVENFEETLQNHSADLTITFRKLGRQMIRKDPKAMFDKNTVKFSNEYLLSAYKEYIHDHPKASQNVSFHQFLDILMAAIEADPSELWSLPEASAFIEKLKQEAEIRHVISQLPEETQKPLIEIYNVCMPAFWEGCFLEICSEGIKQVKALKMPEIK